MFSDKPLRSNSPIRVAQELIAQAFWAEAVPGLKLHRGWYWLWLDRKWRRRSPEEIEDLVWRAMEGQEYGEEAKGLVANRNSVNNVMRAVEGEVRVVEEDGAGGLPMGPPGIRPGLQVPFEDVLVDVETGEVRERGAEWFDVVTLPVKYVPEAQCEVWERCVEEWGEGDPKWGRLLQKWIGYCLVADRRFAKWMLMYGSVRAGKGTICDVIKKLLGAAGYMGVTLQDLSGEFALDGLQHCRVLDVREVHQLESKDGERVSSLIKNVVGRDPITINAKYLRQIRNVVVQAAPMMSANEIPNLPDKAGGLSVKMLLLPFERRFVGRDVIADLGERLTGYREDGTRSEKYEGELEGIAAWAVRGARVLFEEEQFEETDRGRESRKMWEIGNNPWDPFLAARFKKAQGAKEGGVSKEVIWKQWLSWKDSTGVRMQVVKKDFLRRLAKESTWDVKIERKDEEVVGLTGIHLKREYSDEE